MSFEKNNQGIDGVKKEAAMALLRLATVLVNAEKAEWVQGPPRSKPGEHLRMETGNARDQLVYYPDTVDEVASRGYVNVFYQINAWYAPWWEMKTDGTRRKGLADKFAQLKAAGITKAISGSYSK